MSWLYQPILPSAAEIEQPPPPPTENPITLQNILITGGVKFEIIVTIS